MAIQNDTILKQIHQEDLSKSLDLQKKLTMPGFDMQKLPEIRDRQNDTVTEIAPVNKKAINTLTRKPEISELTPISPIYPNQVTMTVDSGKAQIILPERKFERNTPDWIIGAFVITLILLALVRLLFNKYISQIFVSTINESTASRMFREKSVAFSYAPFLLEILFYFIFSLFIFQTLDFYGVHLHRTNVVAYLLIIAGVIAWFAIKKIAYLLQGHISDSIDDTREFLYNMNIYNHASGLLLLPVSLVLAFTPLARPGWVIVIGCSVIGIFYIMLIIRGVKILLRKHFSIFYLILYLCTLEMLPIVFVCKLVLE